MGLVSLPVQGGLELDELEGLFQSKLSCDPEQE